MTRQHKRGFRPSIETLETRSLMATSLIASLTGSDRKFSDIAVRMLDNQAREVLPSEFLPAAERNDLMRSIDRWVLTAYEERVVVATKALRTYLQR